MSIFSLNIIIVNSDNHVTPRDTSTTLKRGKRKGSSGRWRFVYLFVFYCWWSMRLRQISYLVAFISGPEEIGCIPKGDAQNEGRINMQNPINVSVCTTVSVWLWKCPPNGETSAGSYSSPRSLSLLYHAAGCPMMLTFNFTDINYPYFLLSCFCFLVHHQGTM